MMNKILLLAMTIVIACSCKSKKEIVEQQSGDQMEQAQARDHSQQGATMGDRPRGDRPPRKTIDPDQIVAQLDLDEMQEEKFLKAWESQQEMRKAIREKAKGNRSGMREEMMKLREDHKEELSTFLSEDQMKKYDEILSSTRGNRGGKGRRGERGQRGGR